MEGVSSRLDPSHAPAQYEADGGGCNLSTESIMGIGEPLISLPLPSLDLHVRILTLGVALRMFRRREMSSLL